MRENENENGRAISEATPIRIGLILTFLGVFGSGVWWASSITSKMDSLLNMQTGTSSAITELKSQDATQLKDLAEIKLRLAMNDVAISALQLQLGKSSSK